MHPRYLLSVSVLSVLGLLATAPVARASDEPQTTAATYDAWTLRCSTPAAPDTPAKSAASTAKSPPAVTLPKQCEIVEAVQAQGQSTPVVQVAVGAAQPGEPMRLVVQVPIAVWLPTGVILRVGDTLPPVTLEFRRCLPAACIADTEFTDAIRDALKQAKAAASVAFRLSSDKDIVIPISSQGFSAAYSALMAQAKP